MFALASFCVLPPACSAHREAGSARAAATIRVSEGTALYFDVSPADDAIVIDLLGQLWQIPISGGAARALTDAVGDGADDRQPAISRDGAWLATRSDRPAGRGIWVHSRDGRVHRQVTDSALVLGDDVGVPVWLPHGRELLYVRRGVIMQIDIASRVGRALAFDSLTNASLDEPALSADGRHLLVTGPWPGGSSRALLDGVAGAPVWEIDTNTARARRLTATGVAARAPAYAPDGQRVALFVSDSGRVRLAVRSADGGMRVVASEPEIEPRRVRWSGDGQHLFYVAAGRLRRVSAAGGASAPVAFTAQLTLPARNVTRVALRVPAPVRGCPARGFTGIALAPDGARAAMLALGKLWLIGADGSARAAADMPVTALGVSWAPDGGRVAWGDGVEGQQDLWVTDVASGSNHRITSLPGIEWPMGWSPSGNWIAFTHTDSIRVVRAPGAAAADSLLNLGRMRFSETAAFGSPWAWLPRGDTLLVYGMNQWPVASRACVEAELVALDGSRRRVEQFPCRPGHPAIAADGSLLAIEAGLLMRHARTAAGWGPAEKLTDMAALYPTTSSGGSFLYAAADGLHLRARGVPDRALGWPVTFEAPRVPPLLLRNVRIVPLADDDVAPRDVLIVDGRIRTIGAAGTLALPAGGNGHVVDAQGRWLLPGLIDTHLHFIDTDIAVPRAALEQGVTTMREMWDAFGVATAFRDAIDAGAVNGARIVVSGPPFYPSPSGVPVTTDFLWVATDSAEADRGLALLAGFGAGHVKLRYVQTWSGGAEFVRRANAHHLPASGHCAHGIAAVVAGVAGHEHADGQCGDWEFGIRDDLVQLYARAGVAVAPIIDLHAQAARSAELSADLRARLQRRADRAREHTRRFYDAGVPIVTGSDAQNQPGGVHRELQELVRAGLSNRAALLAATRNAAAALGMTNDIGVVKTGYIADLLLLDADPLANIENTRRIWLVIQGGRVVQPVKS